jgi:pyruvate,water dikinase
MGIIQVKKDSKFFLDEDFSSDDVTEEIVGRKGHSLFRLKDLDVPVPPFFVISSSIFSKYIAENLNDSVSPETSLKELKEKIKSGEFDNQIKNDLLTSYSRLSGFSDAWVAVRSSVVPPIDKRNLTFAGLLDTELNVKGLDGLVEAIKSVYSSLFTEKVANYTSSNNTSIASVKVAIVVQKMIQAEASGIFFTVDPISQDKKLMMTEAVFGLGDVIAAGEITPDQYVIDKKTLEFKEKKIVPQEWMMVRKIKRRENEKAVQKVQISKAWQHQQKIDNRYLKELSELCKKIEKRAGEPQDIEWVLEGSRLWILQTRDVEQPQIEIDEQTNLHISKDIIESAQKIAENEKSRQKIRAKIHESKSEKSETKKKSSRPKDKSKKIKLQNKETVKTTNDKEQEIKDSKEQTSKPDSSKKTVEPFVSKPINRQIVNGQKTKKAKAAQPQSPQKGEKLILTGIGAGRGSARGEVIIIRSEDDLKDKRNQITKDKIIVTPDYITDIENVLSDSAGIICDTGGLTSDMAIISREIGIPCIMGSGVASRMLKVDEKILIDGNVGAIYGQRKTLKSKKDAESKTPKAQRKMQKEAQPKAQKETQAKAQKSDDKDKKTTERIPSANNDTEINNNSKNKKEPATENADEPKKKAQKVHTATKLFVDLSNSFARGEKWQEHSQNADGVAVIQIEDIYRRLNRHPGSYIENNKTKELVDELTNELSKVCELSEGNTVIASIGSMTVEQYKNLKDGEKYEKWDENIDITESTNGLERLIQRPKEISAIIKALRSVRNIEGWRNISIAVEFAGTPKDLIEFKKMLSAGGLRRSSTFSIFVVVDTPSVAMVIEDFVDAGIDGAIINMDNLAKLMRAPDPEDESVLKTIENVRSSWKSGTLIVQAPKNPSKIASKAVRSGIKGISCKPSDLEDVRQQVVETERELVFSN